MSNRSATTPALVMACALSLHSFAAAAPAVFADAKASDPITLGWMRGFPPPTDKQVNLNNYLLFPQLRWSFAHARELLPTANVSRGEGSVAVLPRAERGDIDSLSFLPLDSAEPMTWAQSLAANYTDGIVVLHRGQVVYERYFGALDQQGQHMAMSVTKSFVGTLGAMLVEQGVIDPQALVTHYVPELSKSGFANATVRQVLDMTTGIQYSENYADPKAEIWEYVRAGHILPRPSGYNGATSFYEFLQQIKPAGEHGQTFAYKTVNSDVLGWIIQRATGKSVVQLLQEQIWAKLGAEQDASLIVDETGTGFAGGGFSAGLRDMARFGEAMRLQGRFNGQQIIPEAVVADIRKGASQADFAKAGYAALPGWSYRDMWWVSHNDHGVFAARGIHGQTIYIDPKAEMVIARFASYPQASNSVIDPTSLPAYAALAKRLMSVAAPNP